MNMLWALCADTEAVDPAGVKYVPKFAPAPPCTVMKIIKVYFLSLEALTRVT